MRVLGWVFWILVFLVLVGLVTWGLTEILNSREFQQSRLACLDNAERIGITFDQCVEARR